MDQPDQQPAGEQHVYLIGRPPLESDLGFLKTQTLEGQAAEIGAIAQEWRQANDHIQELEREEAGIANNPQVNPLPGELDGPREQLLADPIFRDSYGMVPSDVGIVELDGLVVFQKHINLEYVRLLQATLPLEPGMEELLTFALSLHVARPAVRSQQVTNNSYVFVSPSSDFRFLDVRLVEPGLIQNYLPGGFPTSVVALAVGYGTNYLNAISVEGRLILNNGSHRAYALRDRGVTHAPCVVQRVSRRDELGVIANKEIQDAPERFLTAPRPPLLKDYFDDQLRKLVTIPARARQVRIQFGVEQLDVPG